MRALNNQTYRVLIHNFTRYLKGRNYSKSTVVNSVRFTKDFMQWLEIQEITSIKTIKKLDTQQYFEYLKTRKHHKKPSVISINTVKSSVVAVKLFSKYLQLSDQESFEVEYQIKEHNQNKINVLSQSQIKLLFENCNNNTLGIRDKAMLSVYYSCGLRRNEGVSLNIEDILFKQKLLLVKKGKGNKQRYVPMSSKTEEYINNYIVLSRPNLSPKNTENALFLNYKGNRLSGNTMLLRFKKLLTESISEAQNHGLHTLRHSIATHLLNRGMSVENLSKFLGHSTLESTQIYTAIALIECSDSYTVKL